MGFWPSPEEQINSLENITDKHQYMIELMKLKFWDDLTTKFTFGEVKDTEHGEIQTIYEKKTLKELIHEIVDDENKVNKINSFLSYEKNESATGIYNFIFCIRKYFGRFSIIIDELINYQEKVQFIYGKSKLTDLAKSTLSRYEELMKIDDFLYLGKPNHNHDIIQLFYVINTPEVIYDVNYKDGKKEIQSLKTLLLEIMKTYRNQWFQSIKYTSYHFQSFNKDYWNHTEINKKKQQEFEEFAKDKTVQKVFGLTWVQYIKLIYIYIIGQLYVKGEIRKGWVSKGNTTGGKRTRKMRRRRFKKKHTSINYN